MPPLVHCLKQGIWIAGAFSRAWKNRASMHRHFGASSCSSAAIGTTSCVLHSLREGQTAKGQPSPKARRAAAAAGARLHSVGKRTFKEHVGRNLESEAPSREDHPLEGLLANGKLSADVRQPSTDRAGDSKQVQWCMSKGLAEMLNSHGLKHGTDQATPHARPEKIPKTVYTLW